MSRFDQLAKRRDAKLLLRLGSLVRYTSKSGEVREIPGMIDMDVELYGDNDDVAYHGKAVTVTADSLPSYAMGDTVQRLTAGGYPAGPKYQLQRVLRDDGYVKTIGIN
ncbi:MAG: hypothetical protein M0Q49_06430 [Porticoccaceae bacterium]|nr:hypothetical protein [Porticoccaceae bacterium]